MDHGRGLLLVTKTYIAQMEVADLIGSSDRIYHPDEKNRHIHHGGDARA